MYLKSGNTCHSVVRCSYFGRIVWKCCNITPLYGKSVGKESACKLHTVSGITNKLDDCLLLFDDFMLVVSHSSIDFIFIFFLMLALKNAAKVVFCIKNDLFFSFSFYSSL